MYYTYILYSESIQKFYVGSTANLEDRLRRHNANHSKSTKGKGPWKTVFVESHITRSAAVKLELVIKKRGAARFLIDKQQSG